MFVVSGVVALVGLALYVIFNTHPKVSQPALYAWGVGLLVFLLYIADAKVGVTIK